MRFLLSVVFALVITLCLFLFMIGLVANKQNQVEVDQTMSYVDLIQPLPPKLEPEPEQQPEMPKQSEPEPVMDVQPITAPGPLENPAMNLAVSHLEPSDLNISAPTATWSSSIGSAGLSLGEKNSGYIEVVPLGTRRPNIPEIAWQNKIDGWVLVAFTLTPQGKTRNVRVLDSHPRGIFEEKVIKAVEDWIYDMRSLDVKGDIILTQRIELFWKDYPQNNLRLDL